MTPVPERSPADVVPARFPGVITRFAAVTAAVPDAPAVTQHDTVWTYRQLGDYAAQIAGTLADAGVHPGDVVAVHTDRSPARVAAWIAVLAHRAVLMPLDPATPAHRHERMFAVADAAWILTDTPDTVPTGPQPLALQDPGARCAVPLVPQPPTADEPGYVVFTSGSTGTPKAILGRARSLEHFLTWQRDQFAIGAHDRVAHLASPEFDVSLREVFLPLTCGAMICLPPPGPLSPAVVLPWMAEARVTVAHAVPSVARSWMLTTSRLCPLPDLRLIMFTGEALHSALVRVWRERCGHATVINLYGPTETTMIRCWHSVPDPAAVGVQPLGRPIADSHVSVQRPDGRRAATGEIGEIVIRTAFGTSGYCGAPAADAARITVTREHPGQMIYRTGDLGHLDADGVLRYDGRTDDQVKIHGVRVHLHAVEAAIEEHPDIHRAAVFAHSNSADRGAAPRLVAHVVLEPGRAQLPADVRARLRHTLPLAAIPLEFTVVTHLPHTPTSGKLDRRQLAPPPENPIHNNHKGQ